MARNERTRRHEDSGSLEGSSYGREAGNGHDREIFELQTVRWVGMEAAFHEIEEADLGFADERAEGFCPLGGGCGRCLR